MSKVNLSKIRKMHITRLKYEYKVLVDWVLIFPNHSAVDSMRAARDELRNELDRRMKKYKA